MSKRAAAGSPSRQVRTRGGDVVRIGGKDVDLHCTSLNVAFSKLRALPEAIGRLVALQTLDVDNNPLQLPPRAFNRPKVLLRLPPKPEIKGER